MLHDKFGDVLPEEGKCVYLCVCCGWGITADLNA